MSLSYIEPQISYGGNKGLQKSLFLIFVVLGGAGYAAVKIFLPEYGTWLPVCLACILICIYASLLYYLPAFSDEDKSGDNVYYLGFLYTLLSLGVSLYSFSEDNTAEVVSNFGIALASTGLGMFFRVLFLQDDIDIESEEFRIKVSIKEATEQFSRELIESTEKIRIFSEGTVQALSDFSSKTIENARSVMDNLTEEFASNVSGYNKKLIEGGGKAVEVLSDSLERFSELESQINKDLEAQKSITENLTEVLGSASSAATSLRAELETASNTISNLNKSFAISDDSFSILEKNFSSLKRIEEGLSKTSSALSEQIVSFQKESSTVSKKALSALEDSSKKFQELHSSLLVGAGEKLKELGGSIDKIQSSLKTISDSEDDFSSLSGNVSKFSSDMSQVNSSIKEYVDEFATQKSLLKSLNEEVKLLADEALKSNRQLFEAIGDLSNQMVRRLNNG